MSPIHRLLPRNLQAAAIAAAVGGVPAPVRVPALVVPVLVLAVEDSKG